MKDNFKKHFNKFLFVKLVCRSFRLFFNTIPTKFLNNLSSTHLKTKTYHRCCLESFNEKEKHNFRDLS